MSKKMNDLVVRTLSGAVLCAVMLGAILWSPWSFGLLFALLAVGGQLEFYRLSEGRGYAPQKVLGMVAGLALFCLNMAMASGVVARGMFGGPQGLAVLAAFVFLLVPLMFVCELYRKQERPMGNIAVTLAGLFYVAVPCSLMGYIPALGGGWNPWVMVAYLVIIWANDVFAYLVGMTFGRHRLFERLSPKKSWEGFFGGVIGAVGVGMLAGHWLAAEALTSLPLAAWAGLALVVAVTGVLGDLVESMFKRSAGVKDSGALIPGHGGVLDRFDALLLSAPFVFVYLLFFVL